MARHNQSIGGKFRQKNLRCSQRDTSGLSNFGIESFSVHFQVLQDLIRRHNALCNRQSSDSYIFSITSVRRLQQPSVLHQA